jgi:hypothetical protein
MQDSRVAVSGNIPPFFGKHLWIVPGNLILRTHKQVFSTYKSASLSQSSTSDIGVSRDFAWSGGIPTTRLDTAYTPLLPYICHAYL